MVLAELYGIPVFMLQWPTGPATWLWSRGGTIGGPGAQPLLGGLGGEAPKKFLGL